MTTTTQTTANTNSGNSAATSQEAVMALSLGSVVVNFGTTAKVVGFFQSAHEGDFGENGWPILQALNAAGKPRGGKWLADPAKCEKVGR